VMCRTRMRVALACVLVMIAAGCSEAIPGAPVSEKLPQGVLLPHSFPELDPLRVFREGLYEPLPEPGTDGVFIPGYRRRMAADGSTSKVSVLDYDPDRRGWEPLDLPEVIWSPAQRKWIDTDHTETLSAGPNGSRDWPTVKSVSDYGTVYYTVNYRDLAGQPFANGLPKGFSEGLPLPTSAHDATFSPGARAYATTTTVIGPVYQIADIANRDTRSRQFFSVYSCQDPVPRCDTAATSLDQVARQGGRVDNFSGSAFLVFDTDGRATLSTPSVGIPLANLTYRVVTDDDPHLIRLQAAHPDDEQKFAQAFGFTLKNFACFEYNGEVTIGNARPSYNTTNEFAGFNRIAMNDLLTHWTPQMPELP
jgi:hypothetical protein